MSEEEAFTAGLFVGAFLCALLIIFVGGLGSHITSIKTKTIESKVISIDVETNWYLLKFANGESYKINKYSYTGNVLDLDKSEHTIIEMRWSSGWLSPNSDDLWGITGVIKY